MKYGVPESQGISECFTHFICLLFYIISPKLYSLGVMCVSLKCILPGSGVEQFLLSFSWAGGGVHFTGSLPGSISQSEQEAKRSQRKEETTTKKKIGGCTALLF